MWSGTTAIGIKTMNARSGMFLDSTSKYEAVARKTNDDITLISSNIPAASILALGLCLRVDYSLSGHIFNYG